jgi:nicotinamide mononucleotide transporter
MNRSWEIAANGMNALSIFLAGYNSIHTWWTGITGCLLFGVVFFGAKLYADVTLQAFFVVTSIIGWHTWKGSAGGSQLTVRRSSSTMVVSLLLLGLLVTLVYGFVLHRFTDAYAPFIDSVVLAFSVLGQFLLMRRRYETWWCWLLVNTIAVPLYISRGLNVTALLYAAFWLNSIIALQRWRGLIAAHDEKI